jgi:hypothetical protein
MAMVRSDKVAVGEICSSAMNVDLPFHPKPVPGGFDLGEPV